MTTDLITNSYETLVKLETSWNEVTRQVGVCPEGQVTPHLLKDIFLSSQGNELQFTIKPKQTFLDRLIKFVTGETESENFVLQIQKIKLLFATIKQPLTGDEKARLLQFEDKINALGRYVFSGRTDKTLFCFSKPLITDYQIRYKTPSELIKPAQIKRGLSNSTWKLCWLNSSLKYMAATESYDPLLNQPQAEPQLEELRKALFRVIEALRKNWDQNIVDALHKELIWIMSTGRFAPFLEAQQDAEEFLNSLYSEFIESAPLESIKAITLYKGLGEGLYKDGAIRETQRLQIIPQEGAEIDIEESLMTEGVADDVRNYYQSTPSQQLTLSKTSDKLTFKTQEALMDLPEHLEIILRRGVHYNPSANNGVVVDKKLKLDIGGTITLTEYAPVYRQILDKRLLLDIKPKGRCKYEIIAAIERRGSGSNRGHYVAHTRDHKGITSHNDTKVYPNQTEEAWNSSYLFMLKRVSRVAID